MQLARHNRVQLIRAPGHEGVVGNETADHMARTGSEYPFTGPEPACGISIGVAKKAVRDWTNRKNRIYWESITGLKTGKRTYIRALCQKNEGSVEIKHRPARMGGRTTYRTLSPKRAPFLFKLELTDDTICERCLQEEESSTHILRDCEAVAYLRFRHLGQFFMEPSDYYDAPIYKVLHFNRGVGLIKGQLKGEAQQIIEGRGARAGFYGPPLIHTYKLCN
jgi:hypothetical protein